ncbi:MAG TPA: hypothetical protein VFI70_01545 [Nitrososphaeraceae archaeon]|nr:hypothetical protein [Nitrososphaeraceae archaeon]
MLAQAMRKESSQPPPSAECLQQLSALGFDISAAFTDNNETFANNPPTLKKRHCYEKRILI